MKFFLAGGSTLTPPTQSMKEALVSVNASIDAPYSKCPESCFTFPSALGRFVHKLAVNIGRKPPLRVSGDIIRRVYVSDKLNRMITLETGVLSCIKA